MEKFTGIILAVVFFAGCAATGPKYMEQVSQLPVVKENSARLFVFRTGEFAQYSGRAASVKLDGTTIGKCEYKGFNVFNIPASSHTLAVDMWDSPGSCLLKIEVEPRNEYYFEIKPRSGNLMGALFGGLVGAAAESAGKECGGAFMIEPVKPDIAKTKLGDLSLSD